MQAVETKRLYVTLVAPPCDKCRKHVKKTSFYALNLTALSGNETRV